MSNRFDGSYRAAAVKPGTGKPRGIARMERALKRQEAEARNALTPHMRRATHRRMECKEWKPEGCQG